MEEEKDQPGVKDNENKEQSTPDAKQEQQETANNQTMNATLFTGMNAKLDKILKALEGKQDKPTPTEQDPVDYKE